MNGFKYGGTVKAEISSVNGKYILLISTRRLMRTEIQS